MKQSLSCGISVHTPIHILYLVHVTSSIWLMTQDSWWPRHIKAYDVYFFSFRLTTVRQYDEKTVHLLAQIQKRMDMNNFAYTLYTANIYIFFTLERQWNVAKSTFINCKFSNIFEFFFTLDKCLNYNISMYFKNTMKKT